MTKSHWLLSREAVDAVEAGEAEDASLGYSVAPEAVDDALSSSFGVSFSEVACVALLQGGGFICCALW